MSDNSCSAYRLSFAAPTGVSSSSFTTRVITNSYPLISYQLQGCLGTSTVCGTPTAQPLLWKNYGQINDTADLTVNDLRPSRTYSYSLYGQYTYGTGQTATSTTSKTFTTWPGTIAAPTNTPGTCDGATSRCTRSISWNTAFPGDGTVVYGKTTSQWSLVPGLPATSTTFISSVGTQKGETYFVGQSGLFSAIDAVGNYVSKTISPSNLHSITSYGNAELWVSGRNATLLHSTNNGLTWLSNSVPAINASDIILKTQSIANNSIVTMTVPTTGLGVKVHLFDGNAWKLLYNNDSIFCDAMNVPDQFAANQFR
jgi:hypothetical protein